MDHDDHQPFPKPPKREKAKPKPLRRSKNRAGFTTRQQQERIAYERLYRETVRPQYLLDLARRQGRLRSPDEKLPGDTPKQKLASLAEGDLPLCEVQAQGTDCALKGGSIATTIHHKAGRMRRKHRPHLLIDTTHMIAPCQECHELLERHPRWAREQGHSLSRVREDSP